MISRYVNWDRIPDNEDLWALVEEVDDARTRDAAADRQMLSFAERRGRRLEKKRIDFAQMYAEPYSEMYNVPNQPQNMETTA